MSARAKPFSLFILSVMSCVSAQTEWRHEALARDFADLRCCYSRDYVARDGTAVFTARRREWGGHHLFVNKLDFSQQVLGEPTHSIELIGVTDYGLPVWLHAGLWIGDTNVSQAVRPGTVRYAAHQNAPGGHYTFVTTLEGRRRAFLDGVDVTTPALGDTGEAQYAAAPNARGDVAWTGRGPGTEGYWDLFLNGTNMSASVLGASRSIFSFWLDDAGNLAWSGKGSLTADEDHAFVNTRDLTLEVFGPTGWGWVRAVSGSGHVLWKGGTGRGRVMVDDRDVSTPVVGDGVQVEALGVSESGHALWSAFVGDGLWKVYRDDLNLTDLALGPSARGEAVFGGINASGHIAWTGSLPSDGNRSWVFYDGFNLTEDALGDALVRAKAMAIGDGGHVLWMVERGDQQTGFSYDVWLSTPVPEPSGTLATGLVLPWVVWRRLRNSLEHP